MMEAIIFDMDGVISDTQDLHARVESELLRQYGITISAEQLTEEFAGVSDGEFFGEVFKRFKVERSIREAIAQKWARMGVACRENITPVRGAIELLQYFRPRRFKLALASSSPSSFVDLVLDGLKIRDYFSVVTAGDAIRRGKPDPEILLATAQRLQVKPGACLVIEDGVSGMIAAKRAGMKCIGYVRQMPSKQDYPADFLVNDLSAIKLDRKIQKLLFDPY